MKMFRRFPKAGAGVARLQVTTAGVIWTAAGCIPAPATSASRCDAAVQPLQPPGSTPLNTTNSPAITHPPTHAPSPSHTTHHRHHPPTHLPAAALQVLLFSATLHSPEVRALADKICQNPVIVDLKGKDAVPETGAYVHCVRPPSCRRAHAAVGAIARLPSAGRPLQAFAAQVHTAVARGKCPPRDGTNWRAIVPAGPPYPGQPPLAAWTAAGHPAQHHAFPHPTPPHPTV